MLKILVVILPMVAGAALAGTVRAATPLDMSVPATATVQAGLAGARAEGLGGFDTVQAQPSIIGAALVGGRDSSHLPEPATWAIMLTGFGLVGAAARQRRAQRLA